MDLIQTDNFQTYPGIKKLRLLVSVAELFY